MAELSLPNGVRIVTERVKFMKKSLAIAGVKEGVLVCSDEELRQQLLKEHEEREEQERLLDEQDLEEEQEYFRRRDEEAEETLAEYTEGDTDLLNKKDNPTLNGGGLRTDGSFFGNGRFD